MEWPVLCFIFRVDPNAEPLPWLHILILSSPYLPLTPKLRFPLLFPRILSSLQLNLSPPAASQVPCLRCHLAIPGGNKRACCLHPCFWRKLSREKVWESSTWHIDLWWALPAVGSWICTLYLVHSHLNWVFQLLFLYHVLFYKSKDLRTNKSYLLEREKAHWEKEEKCLIKDFMVWKKPYL